MREQLKEKDRQEAEALLKKALFWLVGLFGTSVAMLVSLYNDMGDEVYLALLVLLLFCMGRATILQSRFEKKYSK